MNYLDVLRADLEKGYSKADLERLIGLPKNNLSGVLKGDKKLSRKSELKIELWEASEKPSPLELKYQNRIEDLAKGVHTDIDTLDRRTKIEFTTPMHEKAQVAIYNSTHTDSHIEILEGDKAKEAIIAKYEQELTTLPDKGQFATQRRKWLNAKIYELKYKQ